jgi:hypothetical protein
VKPCHKISLLFCHLLPPKFPTSFQSIICRRRANSVSSVMVVPQSPRFLFLSISVDSHAAQHPADPHAASIRPLLTLVCASARCTPAPLAEPADQVPVPTRLPWLSPPWFACTPTFASNSPARASHCPPQKSRATCWEESGSGGAEV